MKNTWLILTLIFTTLFAFRSEARVVYYGNQEELVNVVFNQPTIFRFSALVKTISSVNGFDISPVDTTDPDYSVLSVKPLFIDQTADVLFVLDNGETVNLKLKSVSSKLPEIVDSIYDFKSNKQLLDEKTPHSVKVSELELMKAMIRGDQVVGYKLRKLIRTMWGFKKGLDVKLLKVYTGNHFNGYVFGVKNRTYRTILFDLKTLQMGSPNLAVLSQIDNDGKILPKSKKKDWTYLRVVAKPSSVFRDMRLPTGKVTRGTM